jgi:Na+-transporting NADH:ubiquinone oxidoreductase subunit NqrF
MQSIWIIAAAVAATLVAAALVALVLRGRRAYVATEPLTISVTDPVEDVLESPAEQRAARRDAASG